METIKLLVDLVKYSSVLLIVISFVAGIYLWFKGVFPALLNLGNGLAKRRIAIFARGDDLTSLKALLVDSGLFRAENLIEVTSRKDLGKAEEASLYLVNWHDWSDCIKDVLAMKKDKCPLLVYAPYNMGRIPDEQMVFLDGERNTAVTNFRGSLLNDIVSAMITTSQQK